MKLTRRRSPLRRVMWLLMLAVSGALLAACGGSSAPSSGASGGGSGGSKATGTTTLTVGYIPIVDCAPLFIGIEKGFFAQQHLKIKPVPASGGAAIIPAVVSGSYNVGFSNSVSILAATNKGLPLKIVGVGVEGGASAADDFSGLLVKKGTTAKSLAGKTVAVNDLNSIASLSNDIALQKLGVNPSTIKYTEINFPDMATALQQGRVAATWVVEPFVTIGKSEGQVDIASPFAATAANLAVSEWVVTKSYLAANSSVVKRFNTAISEANSYAAGHPAAVRQAVTTYTKLTKALADKIRLPSWGPTVNTASLELENQLAQKYGFYKGSVNVTGLYAPFVH